MRNGNSKGANLDYAAKELVSPSIRGGQKLGVLILISAMGCTSAIASIGSIPTAGPSPKTTEALGITNYKVTVNSGHQVTIRGLDKAGKTAFEMTTEKTGAATIRFLPPIKNASAVGEVQISESKKVVRTTAKNLVVFQSSVRSILQDIATPSSDAGTQGAIGGGNTAVADRQACNDRCNKTMGDCVSSSASGDPATTLVGAALCTSKWSVCTQLCSPSGAGVGGGGGRNDGQVHQQN